MTRTVFIGFDAREQEAYNVAQYSILRRSKDIIIHPIHTPLVRAYVNRPVEYRGEQMWCPVSDAPMSTAFANTRFASFLIQKEGWSVFTDCDIVCLADINELFDMADERYAVMVVKHDYQPKDEIKMDAQAQTVYARKNWSSVMLINHSHPSHLKLRSCDRINTWPGRDLHAFKWLTDDEIGELPKQWNWLVGEYPDGNADDAKILHFTNGHPGLPGWKGGPLDHVYRTERAHSPFR